MPSYHVEREKEEVCEKKKCIKFFLAILFMFLYSWFLSSVSYAPFLSVRSVLSVSECMSLARFSYSVNVLLVGRTS